MTQDSNTTALSFLSMVLEREIGSSRLQHYGLFDASVSELEDPAKTIALAQDRFAARLGEMLAGYSSDAKILLVGDTLLEQARSLLQAGFSVSWIGSKRLADEELISSSRFHYEGDDLVGSRELEPIDVLLHEGSIRYLDQMALLSKARDRLSENGSFIFFGEFIVDDSLIEHSFLPNLSSFRQLSERLGFKLAENENLSLSAQRTLELLQPLLLRQRKALLEEGVIEANVFDAMCGEVDAMYSEFACGRRGFCLFVLERDSETTKEWVGAEFGDIHSFQPQEVAELFELSFNVDFDERLWDWKYAHTGGTCVVARLEKRGPIMAHYGGAPRKISYFGESALAIQPCDVMVHPSIRKQYGKGSLFFEVAATFLEREIGNTVNHLLGFGFPNQKTMNISKRLGLYEKTDDFVEIVYDSGMDQAEGSLYIIEEFDADDEALKRELNALWASMCEDFADGIIGVRDADYIRYRYINHPFADSNLYRCVMLRHRSTGQALAFAVIKLHGEGSLLMDLVCSVGNMKPALACLTRSLSGSEAKEGLRAWVTKSGSERLLIEGAIVNELGIEIPCNSWNPGPSAQRLYGAWWLTAGDMDFV